MTFAQKFGVGCASLFSLVASNTVAQDQPFPTNRFFGFGMILTPLAAKWACGGDDGADLAHFNELIEQYPEDAESSGIQDALDEPSDLTIADLGRVLGGQGGELSEEQVELVCEAALPLSLGPLTDVGDSPNNEDFRATQQVAWNNFFRVVEGLGDDAK